MLDNLFRAGVNVRLSLMGGILDETEDELQETYAFLARNQDRVGIDTLQKLVVEPMTSLSLDPWAHGLKARDEDLTDWNRMMNFGVGRVGHDFQARKDRPDQGQVTERRFADVMRHLHLNGNDEKRGRIEQHEDNRAAKSPNVDRLQLYPWVRAVPEAEGSILISDLSWQSYHRARPKHLGIEKEEILFALTGEGRSILARLARAGFGSTSPVPAVPHA